MIDATLELTLPEEDDEELQALTRDLASAIRDETGAEAAPLERAAREGEKGTGEILGHVAVALLEAGALTSLFKVLGSFFQRRPGLAVTVKRGNSEIRIEGANAKERDELLKLLTSDPGH